MKHMKRMASMLMVLIMTVALMVPAMAAEEEEKGSITINKVVVDDEHTKVEYEIYKLLDLESYHKGEPNDKGVYVGAAYSYTVNEEWEEFFETEDAKAYMAVGTDGYVTWAGGKSDENVAAFAQLALAYAKAHGIDPVKSSKKAGDFVISTNEDGVTSGKFSNLELGYYLVDSTLGALCGLTTTNPDASINAKNAKPTIDKQVKEDSTNQWGDKSTADIGQIVEFRTTINVHAGAENYVLHDKMSNGLTFEKVTKIEHVIPKAEGESDIHVVPGEKYTVKTDETAGTDCEFGDACTFEVHFTGAFCNELATNDKVIVYYQAMLNRNAVVAGEGNPNETELQYGDDNYTESDSTKTYTFGFDIVKTDEEHNLLDGAEFKVYDAATGGNEVAVVLMDDGTTYRRARADETGVPIVVKNGQVRVVGFDNGTYYLEETVAPNGYNKLSNRKAFTISDANLDALFNDGVFSTDSGVHVVNKTGSMLPETGGIGTTIFYVLGGALVLGAGVALVTKKRMA